MVLLLKAGYPSVSTSDAHKPSQLRRAGVAIGFYEDNSFHVIFGLYTKPNSVLYLGSTYEF